MKSNDHIVESLTTA